jgi:hypothetical protein
MIFFAIQNSNITPKLQEVRGSFFLSVYVFGTHTIIELIIILIIQIRFHLGAFSQ